MGTIVLTDFVCRDAFARRGDSLIKPYPFHLAWPLEKKPWTLGDISGWLAEWKWSGIRCQVMRRDGESVIFSRTGQPISEVFPEIVRAAGWLADGTVLDGNILAWKEGEVMPAQLMQRRGETRNPDEKLLREVPVTFMAYDILEHAHEDMRLKPLNERRDILARLLTPGALDAAPSCRAQLHPNLRVSTIISATTWQELEESHTMCGILKVAGIMLKRTQSPYAVGRKEGDWWKWSA